MIHNDLALAVLIAGEATVWAILANKISRRGFTAAFMVQCLVEIGCTTLRLDD